ncbi:MAG: UDP-2,3-diacylglucosamine diphosphatase LpxI, partial [Deferrisomatales bacterium]|nr:UDP-2,3-diacylglucosamine diphosphatase LpxI [Deferrisomatales bacterium]
MTGRIGIIAGAGEFPVLLARECRQRGLETVAVALEEEADPNIETAADHTFWQPLGKVGKLLKVLKKEQVASVVVAGKVNKTRIFRDFKPDIKALTLLWGLKDRKDDTIMLKVAAVLAAEGIELLPQTTYMEAYLPGPQVFTRREPTEGERGDVAFGAEMAREMGRLDVGQTVVVKRGAVLAVEAIEGTDQTIRR